jgi:glycosyltransferase involved in cell wall biosynthesis
MKVAFLSFFNPAARSGGGFERFVVSAAQAMAERGHSASVVTSSRKLYRFTWVLMSFYYLQPKWLAKNPIKLSEAELRQNLGQASLCESSTIVGLGKYLADADVIYTKNEIPELVILKFLSLRWKLPPIVVGMHTSLLIPVPGSFHVKVHNWLYLGKFYHSLLKGCSGIMVHTDDDATLIRRRFPGLNAKIYTIPDFFDLASGETSRHHNDKFVVLFANRLTEQKGSDTLYRVIKLLSARREFSDMEFVIVGSGKAEGEAAVRKLANEYDNVRSCGQVPYEQMHDILLSSDVSLVPSRWETFSRTCLEAQWYGLPVVASHITGPKDIVIHNQTGLLVSPEDAEGFAQAILKLYHLKKESSAEFMKMAQKASSLARERFSKEKIITMLEDMLKEQVVLKKEDLRDK